MTRERVLLMCGMLMASFLGGAAATVLSSTEAEAQGPQVVTATQINLVDDAGRLRGILSGRDQRGLVSIAFYDVDGQIRGLVGAGENGNMELRFLGAGGENRLSARVQGENALLVVGDEGGRNTTLAYAGGTPVVSLAHGAQSRLQMQLGPEGAPSVDLLTSGRQRGVSLAVDATDAPFITLHGAAGRQRIAMAVVQDSAVINVADSSQRPRLVVGVSADGRPSVTVLDAGGQATAVFPDAGSGR